MSGKGKPALEKQAPPFKVGDVVVRITGGPAMAVVALRLGDVHCYWFSDRELLEGWFDPDDLERTAP